MFVISLDGEAIPGFVVVPIENRKTPSGGPCLHANIRAAVRGGTRVGRRFELTSRHKYLFRKASAVQIFSDECKQLS